MSSIVKFEGIWGAGSETPHCYLLTVDDFTFMLDCGWDEKFDKDYVDRLSKAINRVDCVLLSFPDPLHLGAYPYLVGKCQLTCPVYATIPVYKNGQMFMYDWYQSHHSYDEFELFDLDDVDTAFERIIQVKYHQSINMRGKGLGMSVSALPAGHMLGGCMWRITRDGEEDILYAVDYNHKKERHLGGCELDKIFRPSLLITDAFNATYRPERRRQRDLKFVSQLQTTCRGGGNVLVATDTAGRVLEICHLLEQMWSTRESGLSAYTLAVLSNTSYHVMHFAKQMIEWMSEKLTKSFDSSRSNPFSLKHVKFCHTLSDLAQLPSPKVVLASFPDLECGFSRELFMQWASSSKNSIILTSRTGEGTLARRLIDNPNVRMFKLMEKRRVILDGDELEEHLAMLRQHRVMERMKDPVVDSSDEEDDPELQLLESGKHDIICLESKGESGNQGPMRSRKHHHMFPFHEEKARSDEYGEYINHADFEHLVPTLLEGEEDPSREQVQQYSRDIIEVTEPPSKCISQQVTIRVEATVLFIDFEGRSDGESISKIIEAVSPGRIILVRGSSVTLSGHAATLRSICPHTPIHTPVLGQVVLASTHTLMQQIQLSDPLLRSLKFFQTPGCRGAEVAWLDGIAKKRKRTQQLEQGDQIISSVETASDGDLVVEEAPPEKIPAHETVLINELRLSDFKQVLGKAGIMAEFNAGILWCANGTIALRKQEAGNIAVEGALTEDYYTIRGLLYDQYALL
ncbi:Zn-dependent metallo-hydrolase RNA specificity domain [Trinorchestia longiramus]|nr:Zn-dependent metallo-hydrolase RNA specificity domain [Trinorchestia longiramus]